MHPRNRDRDGYNFEALTASSPELARFVIPHPAGGATIKFADPAAVTALNRALLAHHYGMQQWSLPAGYLCPAVPGRADYVHHLADLLGGPDGRAPRGASTRIWDIGVGANCVYPIIGAAEYGWDFVGSDIDPTALAAAERLRTANPSLARHLSLRGQPDPLKIFAGVAQPTETFAACLCNPPYHASPEHAAAGTQRKLRNLGAKKTGGPILNFGGQGHELWGPGGELGFVFRLIAESAERPELCQWFTTLVSKSASLLPIYRRLKSARPVTVRTIPMGQGQKQSRIVAWTFQASPPPRIPFKTAP
jgi:23S rRNA (adenine1618-N6)-methyltransferase